MLRELLRSRGGGQRGEWPGPEKWYARAPRDHFFGFREFSVEVGGVLQGKLEGGEILDEAEASGLPPWSPMTGVVELLSL